MGLEKLLPTSPTPVTNWSAASHFTWARGEVLILLPINTRLKSFLPFVEKEHVKISYRSEMACYILQFVPGVSEVGSSFSSPISLPALARWCQAQQKSMSSLTAAK
ncbi:hypothetical protein PIB30_080343 [Stylosanthes scabra]|uniref:Uncharacterized protein n=1 Tax=Stylosanthes scabra TaxID=79078 RepID=A0ABU6US73_9FABA|nr:hypothetical protein [Stylosanthes scabra]